MCGMVESGLTEIGTETHHVLSYVKYDIVWYRNNSVVHKHIVCYHVVKYDMG